MKHLFLFTLAFVFSCINVSAQSPVKLANNDSIIKLEIRNLDENRMQALKIPAFDTNYFYTSSGVIDTVKILSDTAFHWGGVFFSSDLDYDYDSDLYYGQYIIDEENGRKKPIGKCLWFISSYHFTDVEGNRYRNSQWNRVKEILYYDNEGNLIKGFSLGYENRKIIGIRNEK